MDGEILHHFKHKKAHTVKSPPHLCSGTCVCFIHGYGGVEAQEGGLSVVLVGFGAAHYVRKRQLAVLLHRGETKVLAAEVEQSVEQDDGGVSPQLLTVPQELLLHPGMNITCKDVGEWFQPTSLLD